MEEGMRHGAGIDPPNRFDKIHSTLDFEHLEWDEEYLHVISHRKIEYLDDTSRSVVTKNDSPDVPFNFSLNPYRGCAHGCSYCYARPSHEYLGHSAGIDFETKIYVKHDAALLFREFLSRKSWQSESICFSGITDCYQPAERDFRLTRACLEVARDFRQPVTIITKNALVVRDLDLLAEMATMNLVHVSISITTLDPDLARTMEPRTSIPAARLRAIRELHQARVPVRVMMAPIVPGLTDHEIADVLTAAKDAGATDARYVLLRLPLTVEPVFLDWLERTEPLKAERVLSRIRSTRSGELYSSNWGERMRGTGQIADQINTMFQLFHKKLGFQNLPPLETSRFRVPDRPRQQRLFE
jgi:DNA repair photolyase